MARRGGLIALGVAVVVIAGGAIFGVSRLFAGGGSTPVVTAPAPECVVQSGADADPTTARTISLADSTLYFDVAALPDGGGAGSTSSALTLTAVQLQHASTINAVGLARSIPERGRVIAVATALQESSLRNLPDGDRDSLGLFQQRPSQGWGTVEQISDPVYASSIFYARLLAVPGWQQLPLTEAAQAVQFSGFPTAYAKWEPAAGQLVSALSGDSFDTVACRAGAIAPTAETPARPVLAGTESAPAQVREALADAQAELGGLTVVSVDGTAATVTIGLPVLSTAAAAGALAGWMTAHATGLSIEAITVADQQFSANVWGPLPDGTVALPAGAVTITVTG